MPVLEAEQDPKEAGFDATRLERTSRHFQSYVDDGRLPGSSIALARAGRVVCTAVSVVRDVEAGLPVERDTLWRIYSMTKPVTSVAAMQLWEEGRFELKDPVSRFLPEWEDVRVFREGTSLKQLTTPATEPVRMWHLLTHTAGADLRVSLRASGGRALSRAGVRVDDARRRGSAEARARSRIGARTRSGLRTA